MRGVPAIEGAGLMVSGIRLVDSVDILDSAALRDENLDVGFDDGDDDDDDRGLFRLSPTVTLTCCNNNDVCLNTDNNEERDVLG